MGSDRARLSYDPGRKYRSVVLQQGRVSLESDWNEAWLIAAEELRRHAHDFVGPGGTPDNGFRVSLDPPGEEQTEEGEEEEGLEHIDFWVQPGTMYLGGIRASLARRLRYSRQSEWENRPGEDPAARRYDLVYLSVQEQEVSPVEDSALTDSALGGLDTAQRTRLVQRIQRLAAQSADCDEAHEHAGRHWRGHGRHWDRADMRLHSLARLQVKIAEPDEIVGFEEAGGPSSAENQLIRVQITERGQLVWGYDNGSQLYRVEYQDAKTLRLKRAPRDVFHYPKRMQAVEALLPAVRLSNDDWIASPTGFVTTVSKNYDPDTGLIHLRDPLPSHCAPRPEGVLFLRIWERVMDVTPDLPMVLGGTGLKVILSNGPFYPGDFWTFAVRPGAPRYVLPARILREPQPPEGPRQWICPLALISWDKRPSVTDLRIPIRKLTEGAAVTETPTRPPMEQPTGQQSSTTTVTIRPADVADGARLQALLDTNLPTLPMTVRLEAGTYTLPAPLRLTEKHAHLTLIGAHPGVILRAGNPVLPAFLDGLITVAGASHVTLENLQFVQPLVPYFSALASLGRKGDGGFEWLSGSRLRDMQVSVGLRVLQCTGLTVEKCIFDIAPDAPGAVFGAGVFAGGVCANLTLRKNRFTGVKQKLRVTGDRIQLLSGLLVTPTVMLDPDKDKQAGVVVSTQVRDAVIEGNSFLGLTFAAMVYAETEAIVFADNRVRECYAGLWYLSPRSLPYIHSVEHMPLEHDDPVPTHQVHAGISVLAQESVLIVTTLVARLYPIPFGFDWRKAIPQSLIATVEEKVKTLLGPEIARIETGIQKLERNFAPMIALFRRLTGKQDRTASPTPIGNTDTDTVLLGDASEAILHVNVSALEREAISQQANPRRADASLMALSMRVSGNDISAMLADDQQSGPAILVFDDERNTGSMLMLSDNTLENRSRQLPAAMILLADRCILRGNFFLNYANTSEAPVYSLVLLAGEPSAINGNAYIGPHAEPQGMKSAI